MEIKLLDHGYVRLVDHMGNDLSIIRSARVSYNADWRTGEDEGKDEKLIRYLIKNRHTSPLESVQFTFEVKAPIFVFRQWHRHRTWNYNEVSARYTELPEEFYVPAVEHIGEQSKDNKQVRNIKEISDEDRKNIEPEIEWYKKHCEASFKLYKELIDLGWARELARMCLPFSTYSKMFAGVNLHNLFHFLSLRLHSHAQYEIRVYAEALLQLIEPVVPVTVKAWKELVYNVSKN